MNERRMLQQRDIRDNTSSSVIVRNLSPASTEETITIHFQKRKNGGGEVESVRLLSKGVALVSFETSLVAESVLTRRHQIDGALVALERNRQSCPDEIFGKVAGRLDPRTFGVSFSSMEAILQTIQDETNVIWKKIFDGFVVSGTFEQIKRVHDLLNNHLQRKKQHSEESTQKYSSRSMIREVSTMRQSTAGGREKSTGLASFRAPSEFTETIKDIEVRSYNLPLTSEKTRVKEITSYVNPSLTESDFQEKLTTSKNGKFKANYLDQPNITRNASPRVRRVKEPHESSIRVNNGKPPDQEVRAPKSDGESRPAAFAPSVVKEKGRKGIHLKTGTGFDADALPLSQFSEVRNTSNADGKRLDRKEAKVNGETEDRHLALDNSKGKPDPLLNCLTKGKMKLNDGCENVQFESTSTDGNRTVEKPGTILSALNKTCVQSEIRGTSANSRNPPDKEVIEPRSGSENRPTAVASSVEKEMVLSEDNKEKRRNAIHLKTATAVNVDALSLPQVSEVKDSSNAYEKPQDIEELEGNTAVKDQQMAPGDNKAKTVPLLQCLAAGILKQNESRKNVQSDSTSTDGHCAAENSSSILSALKEASAQESEFCAANETPKSPDFFNKSEPISKEKGKYTLKGNSLNYFTSTGVTVMLVKGDITRHDVNVLFCPANPTLTYEEGLSKRILEKGGQDIVRECHGMIQTKSSLEYGTKCFTSSGKLPCRVVLHAVLPPWINEKEKKKECKVQIHRCLKDGLALASGYRYRSVAFPPLGQDWNCIPLEVSAEIITRVIAVFSKNIGPMHSGINDFRIVCEDDAAIDTFVKEFTSFSFPGEKPFFVYAATKNKFNDVDQIVKSKSAERNHSRYDQQANSSIAKEGALKQMKEETSSPESDAKSAEIHTGSPKIEIPTSSHHRAPESQAILPSITGANDAVSLSNTKQSCEIAFAFISSGYIESTEILEAKALEILEVTKATAAGLQEETTKTVTVQDNTKEELSKQLNLNQNKEGYKSFVVETSELLKESAAPNISKAMTHEIRQPNTTHLQVHYRPNEVVLASEGLFRQESSKEATSLQSWPADQETTAVTNSSLSSLRINGAPFVTSPTVEALLNADLLLGFQGLQIGQDTSREINNNEDHDKGSGKYFPLNQKKDDSDEKTSIPSCDAASSENHSSQVTEKHSKKDINENLETEMTTTDGETDNIKESVEKCDFEEAKETKDEFPSATLVENYHNGIKRTVSTEQQIASLCALCQDTVDHPDLIHPNACAEHKFCDDCILKAFNFSNNCPACVDTYGLLTSKRETNVDHNYKATEGLHQPVSTQSSSGGQEGIDCPWTASLDLLQANQPPGEMMWKKYEDNLPGFEGFGTIVITYTFYDGIQTLEHPSPGESYTGMSCMAYLPDTQEGRLVLKLLRKAFDARLVFTVSKSASDGTGHVVLNGVELKTAAKSEPRSGCPDSGYLSRIRKQLAAKGIQ